MRTTFLAVLVAMGIGLIGTSNAFATPANGAAINGAASAATMIDQAQYYHRRRRYRSYGYCTWRRVCNYYGRCWRVRRCY